MTKVKWLVEEYKKDVKYPLVSPSTELDKSNIVYLFYNPITKLTKIGVTSSYKQRLQHLSSSIGNNLLDILVIQLEIGYDESGKFLESYLHKFFASKRIKGEWFNLSIRDIVQVKALFWEVIYGDYIWDNVKMYMSKEYETEYFKYG